MHASWLLPHPSFRTCRRFILHHRQTRLSVPWMYTCVILFVNYDVSFGEDIRRGRRREIPRSSSACCFLAWAGRGCEHRGVKALFTVCSTAERVSQTTVPVELEHSDDSGGKMFRDRILVASKDNKSFGILNRGLVLPVGVHVQCNMTHSGYALRYVQCINMCKFWHSTTT